MSGIYHNTQTTSSYVYVKGKDASFKQLADIK